VVRIVDIKTPDSGEHAANRLANIALLRPHDEVKFVIGSAEDYAWSCAFVEAHALTARCTVLFGPIWGRLDPADLAAWIVRDGLEVRLQIQAHKYIWGADVQGV
jgi:7-carboxy-7-deazaguanine synthase